MTFETILKNKTLLLVVAGIIILVGIAFFFTNTGSPMVSDEEEIADQSPAIEGWVRVDKPGISYEAPRSFTKKYYSALDWPPDAQVVEGMMTCNEAGEQTDRAGETEVKNISGVEYCVTTVVEGAAGNVYSQYAYAFQKSNKIVTLTFSTRAIQCGNYDEKEMALCEEERKTVNLDEIIHKIAGTVVLARTR